MAITFRHDAAAVVPPSNESTRKYGQSLVLQQQQQKYQGYQAGLDRLFDANRQATQNAFQFGMANRQNEWEMERDKTQFDRQQQEAEAARQRAFLDEGRKLSSRFILDAIDNGEFDPVTARGLRQSLVEEAEALGNPNLDPAQRAEALAKIRAHRSLLLSNRAPKVPEPTAQDDFNRGIAVGPDGTKFRRNSKGDFEPLPTQPVQPAPPATAQEYYAANEDKFQKDLDATMKSMQDEVDLGIRKGEVTQEAAWEKMQKDFQFRQKALGRVAPAAGGAQQQPAQQQPAQPNASLLNSPPLAGLTGAVRGIASAFSGQAQQPQSPAAQVPLGQAQPQLPNPNLAPPSSGPLARPAAKPTGQVDDNGYVIMDDGSKVDPRDTYGMQGKGMSDSLARSTHPDGSPVEYDAEPILELQGQGQPQNAWSEVVTGGEQQPSGAAAGRSQMPQAPTPNFDALTSNAADDEERFVLGKLQGIYKTAQPEVQSAINVLVSPDSTDRQRAQAALYLRDAGIDLNKLAPAPTPSEPSYTESNYMM